MTSGTAKAASMKDGIGSCHLVPGLMLEYSGVAYRAAIPARKSRQKPLPPVALAEYSP